MILRAHCLLLAAALFANTGSAAAQATAGQVASLRGLPGVVVDYGLYGNAAALGVDSIELRTALEMELRRNGIPTVVFSPTLPVRELLSRGLLSYRLTATPTAAGPVFSSMLQLSQPAVLPRGGTPVSATTWEARAVLRWVPSSADARAVVLDALQFQMREFVNAYLTSNPK